MGSGSRWRAPGLPNRRVAVRPDFFDENQAALSGGRLSTAAVCGRLFGMSRFDNAGGAGGAVVAFFMAEFPAMVVVVFVP